MMIRRFVKENLLELLEQIQAWASHDGCFRVKLRNCGPSQTEKLWAQLVVVSDEVWEPSTNSSAHGVVLKQLNPVDRK